MAGDGLVGACVRSGLSAREVGTGAGLAVAVGATAGVDTIVVEVGT
jgi:hypothetical protein